MALDSNLLGINKEQPIFREASRQRKKTEAQLPSLAEVQLIVTKVYSQIRHLVTPCTKEGCHSLHRGKSMKASPGQI